MPIEENWIKAETKKVKKKNLRFPGEEKSQASFEGHRKKGEKGAKKLGGNLSVGVE